MLRQIAASLIATLLLSACSQESDVDSTKWVVDLSDYSDYCADPNPNDPCWLPMQPRPEETPGISLTTDYPLDGDEVQVECQVWGTGEPISNMSGHVSNVWNKIKIPEDRVQILDKLGGWTTDDFEQVPDGSGFYAYASDIWLGDRGMQVPCEE